MESTLDFLKHLFPPDHHGRVFVVGGSVREFLLGRPGKDIDLAAALPPEILQALGFRLVEGKTTAPIWFMHHTTVGKIEIVPLEADNTLQADLLRRDFTVNALAMALTGDIQDPLGGRKDLPTRILRACGDDTFREDPVRIFRAFRFEADGWRMEPHTEALISTRNWPAEMSGIPVERFSREMLTALGKTEPERFFQRMAQFRIGKELLPELFRMQVVPAGPLQHHPEGDLFTHSIEVLQRTANLTNNPLARFCALFHDIGKLATDPAVYPKHHGHDIAGFTLAKEFCNRLCLSAVHRNALAWTSRLHCIANRWPELRETTRVRTAEQAGKAGIAHILPILSAADKMGGQDLTGWEKYIKVAGMNCTELDIDPIKVAAMPVGQRSAFILQKRVGALHTS